MGILKKKVEEPKPLPKFEIEELKERIENLENGYNMIMEFKDKLSDISESKEKKDERKERIKETEHNIGIILDKMKDCLNIKYEGVTMEDCLKQMDEWFSNKPVPKFNYIAYNGYHNTKSIIESKDKFNQLSDSLKVTINQLKSETGG